jgi:hypothetical protein
MEVRVCRILFEPFRTPARDADTFLIDPQAVAFQGVPFILLFRVGSIQIWPLKQHQPL